MKLGEFYEVVSQKEKTKDVWVVNLTEEWVTVLEEDEQNESDIECYSYRKDLIKEVREVSSEKEALKEYFESKQASRRFQEFMDAKFVLDYHGVATDYDKDRKIVTFYKNGDVFEQPLNLYQKEAIHRFIFSQDSQTLKQFIQPVILGTMLTYLKLCGTTTKTVLTTVRFLRNKKSAKK